MADGSIARPTLLNLCLLCFNTGCQIPTGDKGPSIDKWIAMHTEQP